MHIKDIKYLSDICGVDQLNDNIDVSIVLENGNQHTLVIGTPNNIYWCMQNEGNDFFFGTPILFVKSLTPENIEKAINAIVNEDDGRWLAIYG